MNQVRKDLIATSPNKNIWVSANAGTGKTYILTRRILRLLINGNKPEKIICITYTNAAANEMTARIIEQAANIILLDNNSLKITLEELGETNIHHSDYDKIRKNLEYVIDSPEKLKIQTIHSFCQSILKKFPLEANISPFFVAIDEIKQNEILNEIWQSVQSKIIHNNYENLIKYSSQKTIKERLFDLINYQDELRQLFEKYNNYENYINSLKEILNIEIESREDLLEKFYQETKDKIENYIIASQGKLSKRNAVLTRLKNYLLDPKYTNVLDIIFDNKKDRNYKTQDVLKHQKLLTEIEEILFVIKNFTKKFNNLATFNYTKNLLQLFNLMQTEYNNYKQKFYYLDYNDLISKASELLQNNQHAQWILYKLDGGIEHLLLDEAQDTSPNQWRIINNLTAEFFSGETKNKQNSKRTIFIVGDEKQSIYSFQGANIENYYKQKNFFSKNTEKINLDTSYRSLEAILELTDKIFEDENLKQKITNENEVRHNFQRKNYFGLVEIFKPLEYEFSKTKKDKVENIWFLPQEYKIEDEEKNREKLAEKIANKIQQILNSKKTLPSLKTNAGERAVQPKDIMVLIKRRDILSKKIEEKLKEKLIPVSSTELSEFDTSLAIIDMLSVIKFCLNSADDLNLASLLKSSFFNFNEQQLFNICANRKLDLLLSLKNHYFDIYNKLIEIQNLYKKSFSNHEFLLNFLDVLGYRKNLISYFDYNVDGLVLEFLNFLKKLELEENFSNEKLIIFLEQNKISLKNKINEDQNSIKIMTSHSSKGLQSAITIIANANDFSIKNEEMVLNENLFLICENSATKNQLFKELESQKLNSDYSEYIRLLYVSLTRAKDELYIFAVGNKTKSNNSKSWYNFILQAAKSLDYIENEDSFVKTTQDYLNYCENTNYQEIVEDKFSEIPKIYFQKYSSNFTEIITPSRFFSATKPFTSGKGVDVNFGNAVHKLLQYLPEIEANFQTEACEVLLKEFNFDEQRKTQIIREVFNLLKNEEIAKLMSLQAKTEVDVAGFVDGKFVSGKIDRLVWKKEEEIIIIDYKTNRDVITNKEKLVEYYKNQLFLYRDLLTKIYPNKKISPCLVFTFNAEIVYLY